MSNSSMAGITIKKLVNTMAAKQRMKEIEEDNMMANAESKKMYEQGYAEGFEDGMFSLHKEDHWTVDDWTKGFDEGIMAGYAACLKELDMKQA